MCGIAGIFHFEADRGADAHLLKKMTDTLFHRGPDGSGYFVRNNVGLGHRRLSIIDLDTGDQPQFNDDKSIALIFNGEIYNHIELREELRKHGHSFRTNSDTEVIIRAYEQWGVDCQNKFNGMWAFALWDERKKQLFISRDRLGEKPLYYSVIDNTLIFGSEVKSILAYRNSFEPNFELTELYLSLGYIPAPFSFYKNISKLRQGHFLLVRESVTAHKYWDIPLPDERNMIEDKEFVNKKFEEIFYDSVRIRMRSDVPFGAFLSGGLDSGSVVATMSEISAHPVQTFTIGFTDEEFDERKIAREIADKFSTHHSEFTVQQEGFEESLNKVLFHYDEPFGDPSAIPTGYVSKIASQKVKMVLTGDGGDEILSGYNSYQVEKFAQQYKKLPGLVKKLLPAAVSPLKGMANGNMRYKLNRIHRILDYSRQPYTARLIIKSSWYAPQLIEKMTARLGAQIKISDFIDDFYTSYPADDSFYKLMLFQHKVLLPDDFLVKADRMSMANSLETRIPFLDHRLVEFMLQVSKNVKMQGFERKSVLRNTIGKKLPKSVLQGSKKGFTAPVREWFKDKAFDNHLQNLYKQDFGLDQKIIRNILYENKEGKADFGYFIWMLFVLKEWSARHVSGVLRNNQ
jgi:asparagine synthase (glutamine-hydrolysing)